MTTTIYPGFRANEPTAIGRSVVQFANPATAGLLQVNPDGTTELVGSEFEPAITAGTSAQYRRGDKTWQTLNQAAVAGLTVADSPTFAGITAGAATFSGILSQRDGANPQESQLHEQYTSDANRSYLSIRAQTGGDFIIEPVANGATVRGLILGNATHGVIVPGVIRSSNNNIPIRIIANSLYNLGLEVGSYSIYPSVGGNYSLGDSGSRNFLELWLGSSLTSKISIGTSGTGLNTEALIRSDGGLKVRNLANSADATLTAGAATFSGSLQLGNAAAAATPTATHTITIKDSTGTTYRILAVI